MADWQRRLAGLLREGGLSNSLDGLFGSSADNQSEGPLMELEGIKHRKNEIRLLGGGVKIVCGCYYPLTFAGSMCCLRSG